MYVSYFCILFCWNLNLFYFDTNDRHPADRHLTHMHAQLIHTFTHTHTFWSVRLSFPVGNSVPAATTLCSEVCLLSAGVRNETRLSAGVRRLPTGAWAAHRFSNFRSSGPSAAFFHCGSWTWPHWQSSHVQWGCSQTNLLQVAPHGIQVSGLFFFLKICF